MLSRRQSPPVGPAPHAAQHLLSYRARLPLQRTPGRKTDWKTYHFRALFPTVQCRSQSSDSLGILVGNPGDKQHSEFPAVVPGDRVVTQNHFPALAPPSRVPGKPFPRVEGLVHCLTAAKARRPGFQHCLSPSFPLGSGPLSTFLSRNNTRASPKPNDRRRQRCPETAGNINSYFKSSCRSGL